MKFWPLLLLCFTVNIAFSQDSVPQPFSRNTLMIQGGSNSLGIGLIYDHVIIVKPKWKLAGSGGASYYSTSGNRAFTVPIAVSLLIGKKRHHFELRTGLTNAYGVEYEESSIHTPQNYFVLTKKLYSLYSITTLGYRYQRPQGGFFFNIGIDLIVSIYRDTNLLEGYSGVYFEGIYEGVNASDRKVGGLYGAAIGYTFKPRKQK